MTKHKKSRVSRPECVSQNQLVLSEFSSPFDRHLNPDNRWVQLSNLLPWNDLVSVYRKHLPKKWTGRPDTFKHKSIILGKSRPLNRRRFTVWE